MADVVHYRLERMVNELEDLERRGIFTHSEIAEIVKQRRKFEYRLKRPSPLKQDFIAYIEYETQLDRLRRLRKKEVARQAKKKLKKSISDFAGVSRIVEIYRLAVMRYKGDIDLWFRYLEFCRQRKNGRMKKILAQVLRFHPKVPGVWIYAAAWEFDHNLNVTAARALMQNGLRVCPKSEDLWVEYLRMELTYLNKLKARKVALGEDTGNLVPDQRKADEKQWRDENKELFMSLDGDTGNNNGSNAEDEADEKPDIFREHGSSILQTIYSGALEVLPFSFSLRRRFLEIVDATNLAHSDKLRKGILSDMKKDFSEDPEYWDWLARLEFANCRNSQQMNEDGMVSPWDKAIEVYEEALQTLPSSTMYDIYVKFLMNAISPRTEGEPISSSIENSTYYVSRLLAVYEKADKTGCLTEDLACKYVSLYVQLGRLHEAHELAEKLTRGRFSCSSKLWLLRASIKVRSLATNWSSPTKADLQSIFDFLRSVLMKVPVVQAESLWLLALKLFADQEPYFDKLVEISFISLRKDGGSDDGFSLPSAIVNYVLKKDGVECAREIYRRYLALPHPGLASYRYCIKMEENLASLGDKDSLANARKLYNFALATYDQNVSLWKDYYTMETRLGTSETATSVCWRARKTLGEQAVVEGHAFFFGRSEYKGRSLDLMLLFGREGTKQ